MTHDNWISRCYKHQGFGSKTDNISKKNKKLRAIFHKLQLITIKTKFIPTKDVLKFKTINNDDLQLKNY